MSATEGVCTSQAVYTYKHVYAQLSEAQLHVFLAAYMYLFEDRVESPATHSGNIHLH